MRTPIAVEQTMLNFKLRDKGENMEIRRNSRVIDYWFTIQKLNFDYIYVGHVARKEERRWEN